MSDGKRERPVRNFWQDICKEVTSNHDTIDSVVIRNDCNPHSKLLKVPPRFTNQLLTVDEAKPLLDYEYDPSFGTAECHAVYVWGKDYVYFVSEYDGSTMINSVPREPTNVTPSMF